MTFANPNMVQIHPKVMIDFICNAAANSSYVPESQVRDTSHIIGPDGMLIPTKPENYIAPLRLDVPSDIFDMDSQITVSDDPVIVTSATLENLFEAAINSPNLFD